MSNKQSEYISQQAIKAFYEKVANDIANNIQDKGVWAQAFAKADGNEQKAKGFYIELMVEEMILREEAIQEAEREKRKAQIREIKEREEKVRLEQKRKLEEKKLKIEENRQIEARRQKAEAYWRQKEFDKSPKGILYWIVYFIVAIPVGFLILGWLVENGYWS